MSQYFKDSPILESKKLKFSLSSFSNDFEDIESIKKYLILFISRHLLKTYKSIIVLKNIFRNFTFIKFLKDNLNDFIMLSLFREFLGNL